MSRDQVSGLFLLAVAIFVGLRSFVLKLGTLNQPGPGFFPFWGAVILAVLSLVLLVRSRRRRPPESASGIRSWTPIVVAGALLGYLALLEVLGFVAVTFLFLLLLFRLGRNGWTVSGVSSLVGAGACYALFQLWLKTQLPRGVFGF